MQKESMSRYPDTSDAQTDLPLAREIYRAFLGELSAITDYLYDAIVIAPEIPALSALFRETARTEMAHYEALGTLLPHLGASPALRVTLRQLPIRLREDARAHALVLAEQMLKRAIEGESKTAALYATLAGKAADASVRELLSLLSEEEKGHAAAFSSFLKRLTES